MKRRDLLVIILICISAVMLGQQKFSTKTGIINFEASVPSFEEVKAKNDNVSAVLKADTGEFAALALIKGFRFKVALMEEHFNENYIESTKYPKATFKGTIQHFDLSEVNETIKELVFNGILNLHGVDKKISVPATVILTDNILSVKLNFTLKPGDFNIEIPSIVSSKIAEEVIVSAIFDLKN